LGEVGATTVAAKIGHAVGVTVAGGPLAREGGEGVGIGVEGGGVSSFTAWPSQAVSGVCRASCSEVVG
jgi:hypothetical protein